MRQPNNRMLFHLVPVNELASTALTHPHNLPYISTSLYKASQGLEIGFHVPSIASGNAITRVDRRGDLILSYPTILERQVVFEIHLDTYALQLCVRAKRPNSVSTREASDIDAEPVYGDCVIIYGKDYVVEIGRYEFRLVWWWHRNASQGLATKVMAEYRDSLERAKHVHPNDAPTEVDPEESNTPWHTTRVRTVNALTNFEEVKFLRQGIGKGSYGKVYKTAEKISGESMAVKKIIVPSDETEEVCRKMIHREIKALQKFSHPNIIELLHHTGWGTQTVRLYMPLQDGTARQLKESGKLSNRTLCNDILFHILQALDYLAVQNICHRNVKSENILYKDTGNKGYMYRLADFGLVSSAGPSKPRCGTFPYMALELFSGNSARSLHTPKIDVWSLFATIADLSDEFIFPPSGITDQRLVFATAVKEASPYPTLRVMAAMNPEKRASATQLLVKAWNGQGPTSKPETIPPI